MTYTTEQKLRMAEKLKKMRQLQVFLLNKNCPGQELEVELFKQGQYKYIYACGSGIPVASSTTWYGLAAGIINALNDWDKILERHSVDLARAQGLEP